MARRRAGLCGMYLLNWNAQDDMLEATLGGVVGEREAKVLLSDIREMIEDYAEPGFTAQIDYSALRRMDETTGWLLEETRRVCQQAQAKRVHFVTRHEHEAQRLEAARASEVDAGTESYRAAA